MASLNQKEQLPGLSTHEGGPAVRISTEQQLRRSVLSCLLWEKEFYEDGKLIAGRIEELASCLPPATVAALAIEVRQNMNLRHVPLLLLNVLTRTGTGTSLVADTFPRVIQRADELGEFMAIYWKGGKHPLSAGAKKGLARAFANFDEYQLTKYKGDAKVRLRDVMFLTHPEPSSRRTTLYKALADDTASAPDTWEVALSAGADKKETFERLLREKNLGPLALLRNLKGMAAAGVDEGLIRGALLGQNAYGVLPFRYVAAVRAAPQFSAALDAGLAKAVASLPLLPGKTVVLVDVSGSMEASLSARSDMTRMDAACALGAFVSGDKRVFSFSKNLVEVPAYPGLAGIDAIRSSQEHNATYLGAALNQIYQSVEFDRIIVITDEQSHDRVPAPKGRGYMINVASAKNGVGYGPWVHIDGFSENVIRFISETEIP